jgi:protein involved in sex pheromone biosynthesis
MKKLIFCAVATSFILGACATPETSNEPTVAAKSERDDYVTGSRIPRSDNSENYQGSKSMSPKD